MSSSESSSDNSSSSSSEVQAKKTRKRRRTKKKVVKNPSFKVMIYKALCTTRSKKGLSRPSIVNYLQENWELSKVWRYHFNKTLAELVEDECVYQTKQHFVLDEDERDEFKGKGKRKRRNTKKKKKKKR
ncbi:histone h1 [Anaeramoeba flamelloides]|uniref:Histone h1 n=1 Tax=Anaeramoeba flamelloides TaxID=1746091 RepID=A0AAV7Y7H2_9EUKA|nr:histone h1 [Anaeramoeba flamelloides]